MKKFAASIIVTTLLNGLLFALLLLFTKPIYDTLEDVYILYLLGGGFGNFPTELVHYNHILHPYPGYLLKSLFVWNSSVNWYTLLLLAAHFTACCIILFQLLKYIPKWVALSVYLLLFAVFESRLLLTINFTNSSIILGCAGLLLILLSAENGNLSIKKLAAGATVIVLASLIRIHVLLPVAGITLPFLFIQFGKKYSVALVLTLVIVSGLIFFFNQLHQSYYRSHIPNWQQEENYRQKMYAFYNSRHFYIPQAGEKWFTEINLITNGLPVDTNFLSSAKLTQLFAGLKSNTQPANTIAGDNKNWFWINNRLLFCSLLLLLTFPAFNRKLLLATGASLLLLIAGLGWLNFTQKLPDYLLIACLFQFGLLTVAVSKKTVVYRNSLVTIARYALVVLLVCWGCIRVYKTNQVNSAHNRHFRLAWNEVANHPSNLFINAADRFPLQKYYIFDAPRQLMLPNFISSEHFMHHISGPVLERFQITGVCDLPLNNRVLFWGDHVPGLENYFTGFCGLPVQASSFLTEFKQGDVYRLLPVQKH